MVVQLGTTATINSIVSAWTSDVVVQPGTVVSVQSTFVTSPSIDGVTTPVAVAQSGTTVIVIDSEIVIELACMSAIPATCGATGELMEKDKVGICIAAADVPPTNGATGELMEKDKVGICICAADVPPTNGATGELIGNVGVGSWKVAVLLGCVPTTPIVGNEV